MTLNASQRRRSGPARALRALVAFSCLFLFAHCSVGKKVRSAFGGSLPFEVKVLPLINDNSPVAVDLLVVYDEKLVDELLKIPASDWFAKKQQYMADHPQVKVHGWEWVPGQEVGPLKIEYPAGARNVVLYADYHTEGEHRAVVGGPKPFRLVLGERDISVEVIQ